MYVHHHRPLNLLLQRAAIQRILSVVKFSSPWILAISLNWLFALSSVCKADPRPWAEKDTRLATEYLNLLVEKPEYGRVLDLLWELYDKHDSSALLLDSINAQVKQQPHPNVLLVQAHLLRKAGHADDAAMGYRTILEKDAKNPIALRGLADILLEQTKREEALPLLKELSATMLNDNPQRGPLLLEQGRIALEIGKREEAVAAWDEALKLQSGNAVLVHEVAQLFLGAGFLDKALELQRQIVRSSDPVKKLDALYEISRIEEQGDHFQEATSALREGMSVLHFKEGRYEIFFQRLVKLHERFGQLDALKSDLLKAADTKPVAEMALMDLERFFAITVEPAWRIAWLRKLADNFPQNDEYVWKLVSALLDHEGQAEAAEILNARLKNDGTDFTGVVLLRCAAHLQAGEAGQAVARLRKLLEVQGANVDVEKQVLAFAQQKSLDAITEKLLRARILRDPARAEPVFELAAFLRTRGRGRETEGLFDAFVAAAPTSEKLRRMNEVAGFLANGTDSDAAEKAARKALNQNDVGRDEIIRLADVLSQNGKTNEALSLLERAWSRSDSADKRMETDERIFALLSGETAAKAPPASSTEFKLPAFFTSGFGSDAPPEKRAAIAKTVVEYAVAQAAVVKWRSLRPLVPQSWNDFLRNLPAVTPERTLRAAWWCFRSDQTQLAYEVVWVLIFDGNGHRVTASIDVEKLLLDIALADKNTILAIRQLRLLSEIDPSNRTAHQLRLAEQQMAREGAAGRDEAIRILESLAKSEPQNESVLSALARCYTVEGRRDKALALWENAVRSTKTPPGTIQEHHAEALMALHKFEEFIAAQMRLIEAEADFKRRRESFQRVLERLMWADSLQGELPDEEKKKRLDLLADALTERSKQHPFDGFWFEALSRIHERQGDSAKAFAAMKKAYYAAPDAPFSLEELRSAAQRAGDLKNSIYFQKQIAAGASATNSAAEWRELVQLLEQDFRITEADQVRRQLEFRSSQNFAALDDLAKYYVDTTQEDAARRVLEQIARVRPWDARNLLRLAIVQKSTGDIKAAVQTLKALLTVTPALEIPQNTPLELWPWPVMDQRMSATPVRTALMSALDNAPGIEQPERDRLRVFLSLPRGESAELPDDAARVRLRAIEELSAIKISPGIAASLPSEIERAWAMFYGGDEAGFHKLMDARFKGASALEEQFVFVWLGLRSHGMAETIAWARDEKLAETLRKSRRGLIQAVVHMLVESPGFVFSASDMSALGDAKFFSNTELIDITRKLENRQQRDLALLLGAAAKRNAPSLDAEYGIFLARIAEAAGDVASQRRFLLDGWKSALQAERPSINDIFLQSFSGLLRLARDNPERAQLLAEGWRRLKQLPTSGQGILREARLLGLAGADDIAERKLAEYLGNGFLTTRAFVEPMFGRLPPGVNPGPRIDEVNHMRGYWEDLRVWSEVLKLDGLAPMVNDAAQKVLLRNGGVPGGPRSNHEFDMWHHQVTDLNLRTATYPERLMIVRSVASANESVDALLEVGNFLESQGFARECIELYRRLPDRASSNVEYCEQLLRVSEVAWDCAAAIPLIEKLLVAPPEMRPQNLPERLLEEKHARFLARLHDTTRLRVMAFGAVSPLKSGRIPGEAPYLRELALLLEREGDQAGALAAWEQLTTLMPDAVEAGLHRAKIFIAQGHSNLALETLRKVTTAHLLKESSRGVLELRAKLEADAGHWDQMRELMNMVTGGASNASLLHVGNVIMLAKVLADHQRPVEAQSLLVRAERIVKDDTGRFRLRLEQFKLASQDPAWIPQRDAAHIASLLRTEITDGDALKNLREWMTRESTTPHAAAWAELLTGLPPTPAAVLALATMNVSQERTRSAIQSVRWDLSDGRQKNVRRLIAEILLERSQPQLALELLPDDGPQAVRALCALGDRPRMQELFGRLVRMGFPGGGEIVEYAEALAESGHGELADELYSLGMERLRETAGTLPTLVKSYAKFLISRKQLELAEVLLVRENAGITEGLPELLVELYREWNRLGQLPAELVKFHLPNGIREESLFLSRQLDMKS